MKRKLIVILLACLLPKLYAGWKVSWLSNDPVDEVTSYRVWLIRPNINIAVPVYQGMALSYTIASNLLVTNGVHSIYVTAVNAQGESLPSAAVTFTNTAPTKTVPARVKSVGVTYIPE